MIILCSILILALFIRVFALAAKVAWKLTKGIILVAFFPVIGGLALLAGAAGIALIVLVIGGILSLVIV